MTAYFIRPFLDLLSLGGLKVMPVSTGSSSLYTLKSFLIAQASPFSDSVSNFLNCLLSFRDYSPICSYNSNDTFLSFYCPGRVSEEKSRRLPFPLSVHIIPYINYSVWMAEKKDPALSFQRQYKVLSLLFSLMPVPFPLTSYPESFFLFSS